MAVKFKFTSERVAEAATIPEFVGALSGNLGMVLKLLPKMAMNGDNDYIVKIVYDEDGDIAEYQELDKALKLVNEANMTPKRLQTLSKELAGVLKDVINPTSGGG